MKYFFLILFAFVINFDSTAQTVKKTTKYSSKKQKNKSQKGLSDSEKEILQYSKGKNQKKYTTKGKKNSFGSNTKSSNIKTKSAPMERPIVSNGKSLSGNISSKQGFRICIYNGSNREEAFKTKQQFSSSETKNRSYIVYNRPNYKIKVGDFSDKKAAAKALKKYIPNYPSAFITPDIVTVKNFAVQSTKHKKHPKKTIH